MSLVRYERKTTDIQKYFLVWQGPKDYLYVRFALESNDVE